MEKHIINQLSFEISCPSEGQAIDLRHNFTQSLQSQMEAGIDTICSKYSTEFEDIRIDKLEFDLGEFNSHTFETSVIGVFLDKLEQAVLQELSQIPALEREHSRPKSKMETLIHFLETGRLAWWEVDKQPNLNQRFLQYLNEDEGTLLRFLNRAANNSNIWQRIAIQFTSEVHKELVHRVQWLNKPAEVIMRQVQELSKKMDLSIKPQIKQFLNKLVISHAPQLEGTPPDSKFPLRLIIENSEDLFEAFSSQEEFAFGKLAQALEEESFPEFTAIETKNTSDKESDKPEPLQYETPPAFTNVKSQNESVPESVKQDKEKYLSGHGGAVLLAQFFKPFFTILGLFDDQKWKNKDCQIKAVHLINYLCTGETNSAEYNLNLEKLLCGLPLNAPIPFDSELTLEEKQEANALLESVIEHWTVLKNTNVDGLRQAFLLRECIITNQGSQWKINVERKTIDVLLDKIPWGYSVVILPWNQFQIYVEW